MFTAAIHGNITDELLEQFYLQETNLQDAAAAAPPDTPKGTGSGAGVTTHARKEISPGELSSLFL